MFHKIPIYTKVLIPSFINLRMQLILFKTTFNLKNFVKNYFFDHINLIAKQKIRNIILFIQSIRCFLGFRYMGDKHRKKFDKS